LILDLHGIILTLYILGIAGYSKNQKEKERMKQTRRLISILAVVLIGLCIHTSSVWAEGESPAKVIKDFARDYYMLNDSMAEYLSEDAKINEDEEDIVALHLEDKANEANRRGYAISYLQMRPIVMKTKILSQDDSSAKIQFDAVAIRSINPLFRIVGFVFGLLEEHTFQDVIYVVKEDGEWKIAPGAFELSI